MDRSDFLVLVVMTFVILVAGCGKPKISVGDSYEDVIDVLGKEFVRHPAGIDFEGAPSPDQAIYAIEYKSKKLWLEFNFRDKLIKIK